MASDQMQFQESISSPSASSPSVAARPRRNTETKRDFISRLHDRPVIYDLTFGPLLQQGRVAALRQMALQPGDRVLEIGVGTGLGISLYPSDINVVGIDLSDEMLVKAREQVRQRRARNVELLAMDACRLAFPNNHFDIVYAP